MNAHKLRNKFFMVCTGKETENMFMMPIDTGNKAIKTENFEFNSGITMLADVPGENEEALMYQGRYYRLSHERNVYLPDKTMDDRYYLLTLFAIAKELEEMSHSKSFIPGELISMDLVVGLPPLYYRGQYKKFREYFYRDGKIVHFVYMGKSYRVTFSNVFVHMQTYAAYLYMAKEVEWRVKEMTKLLNSQDIGVTSCMFREEEAFLSSLPLLCLDKKLYERSKRNVLTSGVASCYPFTSYEMSDKDGIMMGVNKANNSLVIVDIFNTKIYKNANIAILGTSGAGKTFTMQLMALRLRRKNVQVFIIAPDKGHEFARACNNIGGAFIQISPASPNCINVMEIRPTDRTASEILDGYTVERSELAMKIQSLHIFFSLLIPDLSHEEKQLLDEALVITYAEKRNGGRRKLYAQTGYVTFADCC